MPALYGRHLLSLADWQAQEIEKVFDLAMKLKQRQKAGRPHRLLEGKTLAMIFEKSSTRTRVSFEVGMWQLGGLALFLNAQDLQLGRGEPIKDTARVLSRYADGIMIRAQKHSTVEELARYASVPVINGLTDRFHPCQVLADLLTIREKCGFLAGLKLAYLGDGNNVAHSLLLGGAKMGMTVAVASPPGYAPDPEIVEQARAGAAASGGAVVVTGDPREAVADARVVYTDVWASMGQEQEADRRRQALQPFQLNERLLSGAGREVIVMHCLPARRGEEITDTVIEGPASVVFDQAENRLHVQKAVLVMLMSDQEVL